MPSLPPSGTVPKEILDVIVERIVAFAAPVKIVMFGSAARGTMGPNSDLDLLVIKEGNYDKLEAMSDIRHAIGSVGLAIDVVVVTPEDVERYGDVHCLVIKPALREGKILYAA